jgi:outer membrane receptor protein involved in Fe transport
MFNGYKTTVIVSILLIVSISFAGAQNLYVFDQQTSLPVDNVSVYNDEKTKAATTDELGIVDLSLFKNEEYINLQHPQYKSQRINISDISKMHFRIGLLKKTFEKKEIGLSTKEMKTETREGLSQVELIKQKDIRFKNPSTAVDILSQAGQVYIQKNQQSDGNPKIRGFSNNQLLYYVDGVKMNNTVFGNNQLSRLFMVDVNAVDHAEVTFGPGTTNHGNGDLGGVVNFHLLEPQLSKNQNWTTTGSGLARISSAEFEKTLHANLNFSNNEWAFLAAISYSSFDDLKMGKHHNDYAQRPEYISRINNMDSIVDNSNPDVQKFTAYNIFSFVSKIKQQFTSNANWTLSYYLTQTNTISRYDKLLEYSGGELKYAENYISPQQWMMSSLKINFNKPTNFYDRTRFVAAFQNNQEGLNERVYKNNWLKQQSENVNTLSANLDFEKRLIWNNTFYYGIEFTYSNVDSRGKQENINTSEMEPFNSRYADGSNKNTEAAAYFTYQKEFDNIPVTLSSGLRLSYVSLKSVFNDTSIFVDPGKIIKVRNVAFKANVGIAYHPGNWFIKLNLSSGYRAPGFDDAASIYSPQKGKVVIPNEDLKPEYLYNADLGLQYHFSNLFAVDLSTFFSYLENTMVISDFKLNGQDSIIYRSEMSKIQAVVNCGYAIVYGTSLDLEWQILQQLKFTQSATLIKNYDPEGFTLQGTPPFYSTSTLTFEENNFKLMISFLYNSNVRYENLSQTERNRAYLYAVDNNGNPYESGWWIINFDANYNFAENFLISGGFDNILNYRYRPYSWGITAPGRNFKISFKYNF